MSKTNLIKLTKLRRYTKVFHQKWRDAGGKITTYECGHCHGDIETRQPKPGDVSEKGYWDSLQTCIGCGELNFVFVWPDGTTSVNPVSI